jgi:hypothetical protein
LSPERALGNFDAMAKHMIYSPHSSAQ